MRYHFPALLLLLAGTLLVKQVRPFTSQQQELDPQLLQPRVPQRGGGGSGGGGGGGGGGKSGGTSGSGGTGSSGGTGRSGGASDSVSSAASRASWSGSVVVVAGFWICKTLI